MGILCFQATVLAIVVPAGASQSCDFGGHIPKSRPDAEKGPTKIIIQLYILDLIKVDDVNQEFSLDFYAEVQWNDPRLGAAVRKAGIEKCQIPLADIWRPNAFILNAREYKSELSNIVEVRADGTVSGERRIIGTFSSPLDLRNFPFDRQILPITYISTQYTPDELTFVTSAGVAQDFSEPGWSAKLGHAYSSSYEMNFLSGKEKKTMARFDFEIEVKRNVRYYVWKVLLPLCIIVFASWVVFWIDPTQLGVQTGISTASLLTVIAFLLSLGSILPRLSYLTRLDIFIYLSLIFIFLTLIEALTTCTIALRGNELLARRIDRWSRILFPSAFVVLMVWFWWV